MELAVGPLFSDFYYRYRTAEAYMVVVDAYGQVYMHPKLPPPQSYAWGVGSRTHIPWVGACDV